MKIPSPEFLKTKWFLVLGLFFVAYAFFSLGKMMWQNYQVNAQISKLESEVTAIEKENQKLSDMIAFFQTETFREKEAKEKLGLVKPGEKVFVFPDLENSEQSIFSSESKKDDSQEKTPNYKKWWNHFFSDK